MKKILFLALMVIALQSCVGSKYAYDDDYYDDYAYYNPNLWVYPWFGYWSFYSPYYTYFYHRGYRWDNDRRCWIGRNNDRYLWDRGRKCWVNSQNKNVYVGRNSFVAPKNTRPYVAPRTYSPAPQQFRSFHSGGFSHPMHFGRR
jgi:hypothetical protein